MRIRGSGSLRRFEIREGRGRAAIVLGAVAAINLVLYLTLNLPRMHRSSVAERGVETLTHDLGAVSRRVALVRDLGGRFQSEQVKVDRFFNEILGTKETRMIRIQREVRALAGSFGMDPETVSYQPEYLDKVGLVRFQINVPLVGDYRNLRQFINKIEQSANFLIIDGVALGGSRDGGALLDLNIQLSTFFLSPEMAAPKPEAGKAGQGGKV